MRVVGAAALILVVVLIACSRPVEAPTPTQDVEAAVQTAVAQALPTATPTTPPDIDATVEARMAATMAAMPPTPTPIPDLGAMVGKVRTAIVRITTGAGTGTGVIYASQGRTGYVVTSYHVVEGQSRVNVTVNDATGYSGTVVEVDVIRDLAILSICCGNFSTLEFGDATRLAVGDEVVNIGYALGIEGAATVTRGIVSAVRYDADHQAYVIQSDAPINPGNSGGPMLSPEGRVMGINTFAYVSGYGAEGIGFAISARTVQQRIPALRGGRAIPTPTPARTRISVSTPRLGPTATAVLAPTPIPTPTPTATNLTNNPGDDTLPSWSPDGRLIAFASDRYGNWDIYVMNADGSSQTRLSDNLGLDIDPSWSPDGRRIAFVSERDGNRDIHVMNADGSDAIRLTNWVTRAGSEYSPSWSPDGRRIAFQSDRDGGQDIYVMNMDGSDPTRLAVNWHRNLQPSWSPDGWHIAYVSYRDDGCNVYIMNAEGSDLYSSFLVKGACSSPSWSPDGRRIAFAISRTGNRSVYDIYLGSIDSVWPKALTRLTTNDLGSNFHPSWSPDGRRIAFSSDRDGDWEIYVMNVPGDG